MVMSGAKPSISSCAKAMSWRWPNELIKRRIANRIGGGVDFGAQAAAGATKALGIRSHFFPASAGSVLMRPMPWTKDIDSYL
jgi:hypothetical protein